MAISFSTTMYAEKDAQEKIICDIISSVEDYEKICKMTQSCFEVISNDIPVCLYADIDCKHPYGDYEYDEKHTYIFIDYAKRAIREYLKRDFLSVEPKFAVSISSSPDYTTIKNERNMCHSIHIHITNIKMLKSHQDIFWKNMNNYMNTETDFKDWNDYIEIKSKKFFDDCVYSKNRTFRSVHCSKPGENRPLIIVEGKFKDTIISIGDNDAIVLQIKEEKKCTPNINYKPQIIQKEKIKEISQIIDDKYICKGSYNDWRNIIWALKSESESYKDIAMELSMRNMKAYDKDSFEKVWETYKPGFLTISSFYHYAKMSNETLYKEIITKHQSPLYISLEELYDIFKCCEIITPTLKKTLVLCKEKWWVLNEKQIWWEVKEPAFYIIDEIRKYIDYSQNKNSKQIMMSDGLEKENLINIGKEYLKFYERINQSSYTSTCKQYLRKHLVDNYFEEKLNKNFNFLAFKNGVINLQNGIFREGIQWDDFITNTIQYNWVPHNPDKMEYLKGILKKILNNNDEHLEYFLSVIGYSFIGKPDLEKSIYFMIDGTDNGKGDNGKTFFFDILTTLMPYYVYKSKGTLLEEGNTKVHKQLCMTKGKRLVWLDEFSKTKKANPVLLKEIADGKTIENEVMFGTSDKIDIFYKMFILSNHILRVDPNEEAVYNRYKQISFGSHFDRSRIRKESNPDKLLFIADCGLADKIKNEYYNEVFGIIIEYARKYYEVKLKIPEKFINDAKDTKVKNDEFACWFSENCIEGGRLSIELAVEKSGFNREDIIDGMKRLGFKYNKDLKGLGKNKYTRKYYKGGFEGCSFNEENDIKNSDTDIKE